MSYLLSVQTSTRGEASWSNRLLEEFEAQFLAKHPESELRRRFTGEIPHLTFEGQKAGRTPIAEHTDADKKAFALADELTTELQGASALVVATPMYNWGPPSSLKAWIDRVINVKTFYANAEELAGLPVTFIIASGGYYSEGENIKHDHLRPLLTECFSRIGVTDQMFVNCDPAGPLDRGAIEHIAPDSAYLKALGQIPAAVSRQR
ncbi:MAG: NAD(P)H-dependent oxidoreductase [Actinomycetota bacterium]